MTDTFEQRAQALAAKHDFNEPALAYRRDRYLAGSFADAADREDASLAWRAWAIAVARSASSQDDALREVLS